MYKNKIEDEAKSTAGQLIKDFRKDLGLTQPKLGAILEITASEVSNIERGKRSPGPTVLQKLVKYAKSYACKESKLRKMITKKILRPDLYDLP